MPSTNRDHHVLNSYELEKHFKGIANHTRIDILLMLEKNDSLTLDMIMEKMDMNYHTLTEHISRLIHSGLIYKKRNGTNIELSLSPYGKIVTEFVTEFMYR